MCLEMRKLKKKKSCIDNFVFYSKLKKNPDHIWSTLVRKRLLQGCLLQTLTHVFKNVFCVEISQLKSFSLIWALYLEDFSFVQRCIAMVISPLYPQADLVDGNISALIAKFIWKFQALSRVQVHLYIQVLPCVVTTVIKAFIIMVFFCTFNMK